MRKIIKLLVFCTSLAMLLTLPIGCSDNGSQTDSQEESTSEGIFSTDIEFDADKAFKNIKIDDTLLPSPCSLSDFGEDFSIGMNIFDGESSESGRFFGNLIHDDSNAVSFDIYSIKTSDQTDSEKLAKVKFDIISQTQEDAMNSHVLLSVDGVTMGDKISKVESILGVPESLTRSDNEASSYTYIDADDTSRKIRIDFTDGTVSSITIYYNILSD